jgi:hypothetical protein
LSGNRSPSRRTFPRRDGHPLASCRRNPTRTPSTSGRAWWHLGRWTLPPN